MTFYQGFEKCPPRTGDPTSFLSPPEANPTLSALCPIHPSANLVCHPLHLDIWSTLLARFLICFFFIDQQMMNEVNARLWSSLRIHKEWHNEWGWLERQSNLIWNHRLWAIYFQNNVHGTWLLCWWINAYYCRVPIDHCRQTWRNSVSVPLLILNLW